MSFLRAWISVNQGFCGQSLGQRVCLFLIGYCTFGCTVEGEKQVAKIDQDLALPNPVITSLFAYQHGGPILKTQAIR